MTNLLFLMMMAWSLCLLAVAARARSAGRAVRRWRRRMLDAVTFAWCATSVALLAHGLSDLQVKLGHLATFLLFVGYIQLPRRPSKQ